MIALYQGNFNINKAPVSLKDALDEQEIERANTKFGFRKETQTSTAPTPVLSVTNDNAKPAPGAFPRNLHNKTVPRAYSENDSQTKLVSPYPDFFSRFS